MLLTQTLKNIDISSIILAKVFDELKAKIKKNTVKRFIWREELCEMFEKLSKK